mgnify:CR=1 FL=1
MRAHITASLDRFNRYIVECKFKVRCFNDIFKRDLIDT